MTYPDSKHLDPLRMGELYQEIIRVILSRRLRFDLHFHEGQEQQYTLGESEEGVEIKLDAWCGRTGRLSIEVAEKTRAAQARFVPSGIMRQDNSLWYVQGDLKHCWVFKREALRAFFRDTRPAVIEDDPSTIRKFYLPVGEANRLASDHFGLLPFVCEYGEAPGPGWKNCEPCLLFRDGRCQSAGAKAWPTFVTLRERLEAMQAQPRSAEDRQPAGSAPSDIDRLLAYHRKRGVALRGPGGEPVDWPWCLEAWDRLGRPVIYPAPDNPIYDLSLYLYTEKLTPERRAGIAAWLKAQAH